jgi:hypothetical protein
MGRNHFADNHFADNHFADAVLPTDHFADRYVLPTGFFCRQKFEVKTNKNLESDDEVRVRVRMR